jgi:hypothetical protein
MRAVQHKQLVVLGCQHNKNKPIELLMFWSTAGTIFMQSHQICLLLLNCPNMDLY